MQERAPGKIDGFVVETERGYKVCSRATTSVLANELLLRRIIEASAVAKGIFLDVGSGDKPYFAIFRPRVTSYVSIDLLETQHAAMPTVYGNAECLPFAENTFDTVLCSELIEHCAQPCWVVEEISRVLRPGGYVILSAPQTYRLHDDPNDYYRFTKQGLTQLVGVNCGLTIEYMAAVGGTVDFAVDFYSKLVEIIAGKFHFFPGRLGRFFSVLPQVAYLRMRKLDFNDEAFTLGHVLVATKQKT